MKKYVFVYYGGKMPDDMDEAQMKEVMEKWTAWFGTFKDNMVDGGNPFAAGAQEVLAADVKTIAADMWPAKGYTIINAESMETAIEIAKGCPALVDDDKGAVRVYEAMPM